MPNIAIPTAKRPKQKAPRERLVTIRLEADQIKEMARQMAISGRAGQADQMNDALTRTDNASVRMPIEEAVRLAISVHRAGSIERAEAYYRTVIKADPKHPRANHFLGILLHQTQRTKEALIHVRRSLLSLGDQGWAWNNLGNILVPRGEVKEAEDAYRKAIALQPDMADAHNNYSTICRHQGRLDEAVQHADRALEINPDFAEAHMNRGKIHMACKESDLALASFSRALVLNPPKESAGRLRSLLAFAYQTLEQYDKAVEVYRDWIKDEPDNAVAHHMLQACLGEDVPERASDAFVSQIFDRFANSFDAKLAHLGYRAPELIAGALAAAYPAHASYGVLADAGCGTGLCAPLVRDRTKRLVGVDLSAGMIAKATERGGYDELHVAELTAFLLDRSSVFDTLICTDTLCYFGVLDGFMQAAHGAMKPGAVLAFTVEALKDAESDAPFHLQLHGRYSHAESYVKNALREGSFEMREMRSEALRNEGGKPVMGWIVAATRN